MIKGTKYDEELDKYLEEELAKGRTPEEILKEVV
jgi:hypothetical protein